MQPSPRSHPGTVSTLGPGAWGHRWATGSSGARACQVQLRAPSGKTPSGSTQPLHACLGAGGVPRSSALPLLSEVTSPCQVGGAQPHRAEVGPSGKESGPSSSTSRPGSLPCCRCQSQFFLPLAGAVWGEGATAGLGKKLQVQP